MKFSGIAEFADGDHVQFGNSVMKMDLERPIVTRDYLLMYVVRLIQRLIQYIGPLLNLDAQEL